MIRKAQLEAVRESIQKRTWTARNDLRAVYFGDRGPSADSPVLFKKGTRLKIWLVSKSGWLKLKAYPAEDDREQARGKTIIYIFAEDIRDSIRARSADNADPSNPAAKDKQAGDGADSPILIPAEKIEELALKHLRQKINELLE